MGCLKALAEHEKDFIRKVLTGLDATIMFAALASKRRRRKASNRA